MSVKMNEGGSEGDDELIDLNKEPMEKKRKRVDKGNEGSGTVSGVTGRVLRSRTVSIGDGEKKVIEVENEDGGDVPISEKGEKVKRKRGRPPKVKGEIGASSPNVSKKDDQAMSNVETLVIKKGTAKAGDGEGSKGSILQTEGKKKGRRGRPPKTEGKSQVSSMSLRKKDGKAMQRKAVDESNNGAGRGDLPVKRRRGRPPKVKNESAGLVKKNENENAMVVSKNKRVKRAPDHKKPENVGSDLKVDESKSDVGSVIRKKKKQKGCAGEEEMGLREQKQVVRNQIVAMLMKAGWTIEYRQRQSRGYQDAIYVDRNGRTHWSVTLAYKKLKEKIDGGKAEDVDISAFSPIPEETLSILFRITEKGKKAGKSKKDAGKTKGSTKKESSKGKPSDRSIKGRADQGKKRTLLARRPADGSGNDGYVLYEGKRSLLSWMIDMDTVPLGGKVKYRRGKLRKLMIEGKITRDGIRCDCCNMMHTLHGFEAHAKSGVGKPYQSIYLDSGRSLLQCLETSWTKHQDDDNTIKFVHVDVDGDDPNDDTCNVCGDGGNLICCDSCPSTFHHNCLGIKVPSGDWNCVYCSCKFCGMTGGETLITDDDDELTLSELFTCSLCEEKFHINCFKGKVSEDIDYENPSFCGKECLQISERLQVLIGVTRELADGFSYTLLHHRGLSSDASPKFDPTEIESNCKLAVAFTVMDECFKPITDERSGSNMIHNVVYNCGSNIRRLNYSGFHTIILEKGDEVVAAASIRIHGSQLAEMPFIGTRYAFRRQGMCSRLLNAIETVLGSLGVEKLVIPAIPELNETWTKIFGFAPLEESKRKEMIYMSMVVFPGVDMLQKPIPSQGQNDAAGIDKESSKHAAAAMVESGGNSSNECRTESDNQEKLNKENGDLASSNSVPHSAFQKEVGGGSVEPENSLDNSPLKQNTAADCKLEAQRSSNNACLNGLMSVNGNGKIV